LQRYVATRGILGTFLVVVSHPYFWLRKRQARRIDGLVQAREREFDRRFGVETATFAKLSDLDIPSPNWVFGTNYAATPPALFEEMLGSLDIRYDDFVFVDYGSGKGRTLLLASRLPFKSVIGVEFSPELHEVAVRNIDSYPKENRACADVRSVLADAARFDPPSDPLVCYFFNPFSPDIMRCVLANIERSLERAPREIVVVYLDRGLRGYAVPADKPGASFTSVFDETGFLRPVKVASHYCVYKNAPRSEPAAVEGEEPRVGSS
jgi:SAM-dependent methyltransferase